MVPTEQRYWEVGKNVWARISELIDGHGISIPNIEENWNEEQLRIELHLSLKQIKFALDSPVFWTVLHKNKDKMIVWENKVWVPK
jgi:hypothetical protein